MQIEVLDTSMGEEVEVADTESISGLSVVVRFTPSAKDAAAEVAANRGLALLDELASKPPLAEDLARWQAAISTLRRTGADGRLWAAASELCG